MPIKPENAKRYPEDWPQIRARILAREYKDRGVAVVRTAVAETSVQAYREIEAEGTLGAQQKTILLAIHAAWTPGKDWSLQELVKLTGIPINAVSGRVNSLKNIAPRYLVETKKRRCSVTGRLVMPVTLRYPKAQAELFS